MANFNENTVNFIQFPIYYYDVVYEMSLPVRGIAGAASVLLNAWDVSTLAPALLNVDSDGNLKVTGTFSAATSAIATAAAPTYVEGSTDSLSMDLAGNLRVIGSLSGTVAVSNFPAVQPVSGPLTDAELRASPVPVSGDFASDGLTDAQLRAAPVPVTDTSAKSAQEPGSPFYVSIIGDPNGDFAGVNLLEKLVDDSNDLTMAVKVVNPPKLDANGALVLSDAPAPIRLVGAIGQFLYIDTAGYQSIQITSPSIGGLNASAVGSSNDGALYSTLLGYVVGAASGAVSTISGGTSSVFPVTGKIVRILISGAGSAVAYLRNIPAPNPSVIMPQNIAQAGGSTIINGGSAGSLGVGGNVASGAAQSTALFPVMIAGIDSGTPGVTPIGGSKGGVATRAMLTDNTGRLRIAEETPVANLQNGPALNVQDSSQFEGQSIPELLAQILLEMKINNQLLFALPQQMYTAVQSLQLPSTQQSLFAGFALDEPASFRSDPTIFNQ